MKEKMLGKIESITFGHVGYQDAMLGFQVVLSGSGWGVCPSEPMFWDPHIISCDSHCKWTEDERDKAFAVTMRRLSDLMHDAKVHNINHLVGKPVEAIFEDRVCKSWRILTEVL